MGDGIIARGAAEVSKGAEPGRKKSKMVWALRRGAGNTELGEQEAEAKPIE